MEIKLKVSVTTKELFNFMLYHTYTSFSGYIGLLLSFCALSALVVTWGNPIITTSYKIVLLLTGLLFTVIQPLVLYLKSNKQVKKNEAINKPLIYTFSEREIKVSQDEENIEYSYNEVLKVKSTKNMILVYVSKYRAFLLPRTAFSDGEILKLKDLMNKKATSARSLNFGKII